MLAGERPEELVMPVRQRLIAGAAIAAAVQCQRALVDNSAVAGWRPRLDLPGHGLARIKAEGIKVEDTYMRLITRIGHRRSRIVDLDGAVVARGGRLRLAGYGLPSHVAARRTGPEEHEGEADQGEQPSDE
jgi:hypothetical protein